MLQVCLPCSDHLRGPPGWSRPGLPTVQPSGRTAPVLFNSSPVTGGAFFDVVLVSFAFDVKSRVVCLSSGQTTSAQLPSTF